jgi:predicted HicB family RNase H-like nuclease
MRHFINFEEELDVFRREIMNNSFTNKEIGIIRNALKNAHYLICDEYESLCNDELKENYDQVLENLDEAIKIVTKE